MTAARMVIVVEQLAAFKGPLVVARGLLVVVSARLEVVELSEIKVKATVVLPSHKLLEQTNLKVFEHLLSYHPFMLSFP